MRIPMRIIVFLCAGEPPSWPCDWHVEIIDWRRTGYSERVPVFAARRLVSPPRSSIAGVLAALEPMAPPDRRHPLLAEQ